MEGGYKPIAITRPRRPTPISQSSTFRYRNPHVYRLKSAAASSIEFSPVAPHDFAVASSLQVDIFSTETNAVYRTLSRFKDVVRCASFRHDGKMLAASDERGSTQLFDMGSRTVMRTFAGHTKAVHVARFNADGLRLFTASDDGQALCWDVAAETQLCTLEGHTDFVRSGALSPSTPHVFATGSYDHTVRLWDVRAPRCMMTLRHVAPVEDCVLMPGGSMLASASGSTLTVWDLLTGRILQAISAHSKTITSLRADASGSHLFSASLDRTVKGYEIGSGKVVSAIKYDAPLVRLALSPTGSRLVVGTTDSSICVRRRRMPKAEEAAAAEAAARATRGDPYAMAMAGQSYGRPGQVAPIQRLEGPRPGTYKYFLRGRSQTATLGDVVAEGESHRRLASFDKALKRFRYHEAFDAALKAGSPEVVVAVVEELVQRNGLRIALQGRDQQTLQPVVAFLARQITNPPFTPTLLGVANLLLDMYAPVLGQSATIDELFVKLRNTVEAEMRLQSELAQLLGAMDVLLAGAAGAAAGDGGAVLALPEQRPAKMARVAVAEAD